MDPFYQIRENTLRLPGVKGTHVFLHVSDTHVSTLDALSPYPEARRAFEQEYAWSWVRRDFAAHFHEPYLPAHNLRSEAAFDKFMTLCADEKPEALLLSGDVLDFPHGAGWRFLQNRLSALPMPVLYAPGNHEPGFFDLPETRPYQGTDGLAVYRGEGFTIAAVDDSQKVLRPAQYPLLEKLFSEGTPLILLMHDPLCTRFNRQEMSAFSEYYLVHEDSGDPLTARFIARCMAPDSPVAAILCGHVHGYHLSEFAPGKVQICASSGLIGFAHRFIIEGL